MRRLRPKQKRDDRYKNHRLLALYFDMSAMPPADQIRALSAAEQFIRTQMTTVDLVSILRYQGGAVDILPGLHRRPQQAVQHFGDAGGGRGFPTQTRSTTPAALTPARPSAGRQRVQHLQHRPPACRVADCGQMLGQFNEKKSLIYFASGLRLNGMDNQAQLMPRSDAAIKAGVSFWPIDARGLVAQAPLGDATQGSPGNAGIYTGAAAQAVTSSFQQSQDTLYALAGDTGGKALLDNNDLTTALCRPSKPFPSYYIIGYYTTNTARTGSSGASRSRSRRMRQPS